MHLTVTAISFYPPLSLSLLQLAKVMTTPFIIVIQTLFYHTTFSTNIKLSLVRIYIYLVCVCAYDRVRRHAYMSWIPLYVDYPLALISLTHLFTLGLSLIVLLYRHMCFLLISAS